jgi:CheY-like chemotaxis protein
MSVEMSNAKPHVLFVEDEVLVSALMSDVLEERGFEVHAMETGDAALEYLQSGAPVDVLFTDINMPGDLDGAELAREARNLRPDLPVVYASGRYTAGDLMPMVPRSLFLAKPYDPIEACTLLNRLAPAA